MKKLTVFLLSILLPMTAQAEQYVCVETQGAFVSHQTVRPFSDGAKGTYLVDTESGFRLFTEDDYEGVCKVESISGLDTPGSMLVVCESSQLYRKKRLLIDYDNNFNYVDQFGTALFASVGTCTKL